MLTTLEVAQLLAGADNRLRTEDAHAAYREIEQRTNEIIRLGMACLSYVARERARAEWLDTYLLQVRAEVRTECALKCDRVRARFDHCLTEARAVQNEWSSNTEVRMFSSAAGACAECAAAIRDPEVPSG